MTKEIIHTLQGGKIVPQPSQGNPSNADTKNGRSQVVRGDEVVFQLGPEFRTGRMAFQETSPFGGSLAVQYAVTLKVPLSAKLGVYVYDCTATNQQGEEIKSPGGGEFEVIIPGHP